MNIDDVVKKGEKVFGEIIYKAFPLMNYGIEGSHEFAWKSENVFDAIEILQKKEIPILGGDVCYLKNGKIDYTYDNWYLTNDELEDGTEKTYKKTINYINNYIRVTKNDEKYLFVLVFDYKKYLDLHNDDEDVLYIH